MPSLPKTRISSIDLLKGLVMVVMAIDHVRDYFHYASYFFDPADPAHTTLPIFFTRFITNFCAPVFSFLAGLSAFISGQKKTKHELSVFLFKRGCWLIFVELVIMTFGWHFDIYFHNIHFQVIWVLGLSMTFLAGFIHLPNKYLLLLSCLLIFGHNLLDNVPFKDSLWWTFIHGRKRFSISPGHTIGVGYSLIPWIAVMSLGYCFGTFYTSTFDPAVRKKLFNRIGWAALVLLLVLRFTNIYGDPSPWKDYGNFPQNLMSFLNVSKYPPSLCFLLVTLGAALLFLANTETLRGKLVDFFCVFGRVPFFFYIVHIYLIHAIALLVASFTDFGWQKMILPSLPFRVEALKGFGFNLVTVYLIWAGVIAILYLVCKKFDQYKQANKHKWWLSYL